MLISIDTLSKRILIIDSEEELTLMRELMLKVAEVKGLESYTVETMGAEEIDEAFDAMEGSEPKENVSSMADYMFPIFNYSFS